MSNESVQLRVFLDGDPVYSAFLHKSQTSALNIRGIVDQFSAGKWKILEIKQEAQSDEVTVNVTNQTQSAKKG